MNHRILTLFTLFLLAIGLVPSAAPAPAAARAGGVDLFGYPALEVTQGVQTYKPAGNVPLVAGKRTFVFFYARTLTGGEPVTTAKLTAVRNGVSVTLQPLNAKGEAKLTGYLPDRYKATQQFRFELPSSHTQGTVSLTAEVNPGHNRPAETDYTNNTGQKTVTFEAVPELSLAMYDVQYRIIGHGSHHYSVKDIEEPGVRDQRGQMIDWLRAAYPLHKINWDRRSIYMGRKIKYGSGNINMLCTTVNLGILYNATHSPAGPNARGYGMVSRSGAYMRGCAEVVGAKVASGPTGLIDGNTSTSTGDDYGGHELGHIFGREHPKPKICGEGLIDSGPYPYSTGLITPNPEGYVNVAQEWGNAVLGFNIATNMQKPYLYTNNSYDVMTYCGNRWLSDFSYKTMMNYFQNNFGLAKPAQAQAPSAPMDRFVIMGAIDSVSGTVMIEPIYVTPNLDTPASHQDGDHTIVLRNAAGAELLRYPFAPSAAGEIEPASEREQREGLDPGHPAAQMLAPRYIFEFVPWVAGTARIDLEGPGGALLHTIQPGAAAPVVQLTEPNTGGRVDSTVQELTVSWTASDPDGDPLTYRVEYSSDGGQSWYAYTQAITETSIALPQDVLRAGPNALIRVAASDGVNTALDVPDMTLDVLNHPPVITLTPPTSGIGGVAAPPVFAQGQTITAQADAYDIDEGSLSESVQWTSSLDGPLGAGEVLSTASLSVGTHTLTAEVLDADSASATAQTQVTVVAALEDLPAIPDELVALPGSLALSTMITGTQVYISNLNANGALTWNATADQNWVQLSALTGPTDTSLLISYDRSMLGDGRYEATVTLTSPQLPGASLTIPVVADIVFRRQYIPMTLR